MLVYGDMPSLIEGSVDSVFAKQDLVLPGTMARIEYFDADINKVGIIVICCDSDDAATDVFNLPGFGRIQDHDPEETLDMLDETNQLMELGGDFVIPLVIETETLTRQIMRLSVEHRYWMTSN